jgi:hypothetical protein
MSEAVFFSERAKMGVLKHGKSELPNYRIPVLPVQFSFAAYKLDEFP